MTHETTAEPPYPAEKNNRRVIHATCVIRLDKAAATQLFDLLGEWLG